MNKQFSKMSNVKMEDTYAGFKLPAMGGLGAVLSLGLTGLGAFKMVTSENGSFKGKGMDMKWGNNAKFYNPTTGSVGGASNSQSSGQQQTTYYYAY